MRSYRLIICFDLRAESLGEAYDRVAAGVHGLGISWESSEEYFVDGELGEQRKLDEVAAQYWRDRRGDP